MNRWETKLVITPRVQFEIFIKGKGDPLCVTHLYSEFNDSGDRFADVFSWDHQVYLINLREAGNSVSAHEPYELGMVETVLDLEAIRETLGILQWHYAGHSTGGMLGLVYGWRHPESLASLIVVGAAAREYASSSSRCIYHSEHPQYSRMQELIEQVKLNVTDEERRTLSKERTMLSLYDPERYDEYFTGNIHKKMSANRMNFFAREVLIYDITRQLHHIKARTLVVCGKHDVQCPLPFSEEIHDLIPNAELKVFEYSNHYPFLEEAGLFDQVVKEFLLQVKAEKIKEIGERDDTRY